jgi:hypothetical protein
MPFIGNQPALSYTSFAKQDFTTSATTSYTLDQPVANANELALFINFVRQEPTTAYTASGTSLTLTSATSASDDMYCVFLGKAVQTVNPPSGSVGTAQIADGSITEAKFSSGVSTITEADMWRLTADITADVNPITSNLERVDDDSFAKIGTGMSVASGAWTFPRTGLYYVSVKSRILASLDNVSVYILGTINNSTYDLLVTTIASGASGTFLNDAIGFTYVNVTDTSNVKVRFQASSISAGSTVGGSSSDNQTTFTFIRLGDSQ